MSLMLSARLGTFRNEFVVLLGLFVLMFLLPGRPPLGIYVVGIAAGCGVALHAMAIVLVYRTNRFLNFAQFQLSAFAATLFAGLVNGQPLLRLVSPDPTPGPIARDINFVVALCATAALVIAGTAALYLTVIRRFASAPRVMPTLATIFVGQALLGLNNTMFGWLQEVPSQENFQQGVPNGPARGPIDFTVSVGDVTLGAAAVLTLLLVPLAAFGMTRYLWRSTAGIAIRAAGENPDRARALGVDVFGVTSRMWLLVGLLAALAGVLQAIASGAPIADGGVGGGQAQSASTVGLLPVGQLVLILTVTVFARFTSLPLAVLAAITLTTLRTSVQWAFDSTVTFEVGLVLLVGGLLLLHREPMTRARREEGAISEVAREPHPVPAQLRKLSVVRRWTQLSVLIAAVALLGLPWVLRPGQVSLAGTFLITAVVGLSLLVLTGWAGQISLGQWGFAAVGGWVFAVSGLPLPIGLVVAGVVGAGASVVVGFPALKLRGLHLAIATLAFAWSASFLLFDDRFLGGRLPASVDNPTLLGVDLSDVRSGYYVALVFCALFVVATLGLRRSRFARALIAVRVNEEGAEAFGIDPQRLRLLAFAVSGAYAGMAGAMFVAYQGVARSEAFAADESVRLFMFTVLGGLGGISGPLLGFLVLGVLSFLSSNPVVSYFSAGIGGLLLLIAAPGGLAEVCYRTRDAALRRLATRHRIPATSLLGDRATQRLREHAQLREQPAGQRPMLPPVRYELPGQWALERYGLEDGVPERVGAATPVFDSGRTGNS